MDRPSPAVSPATPRPSPPLRTLRRSRWVCALIVLSAVAATVLQRGFGERAKARLADAESASGELPLERRLAEILSSVDVVGAACAAFLAFAFAEILRAAWNQAREPGSGGLGAFLPRSLLGRLGLLLAAAWTFLFLAWTAGGLVATA